MKAIGCARRFAVPIALVTLVLLTLAGGPVSASLQVIPDALVVEENASFRLTIRLEGTSSDEALDLAPLERDFEIVGQQTASQFRSINGRVETWTDWILALRPRRTGTLEIPSLTLGSDRSEPIAIEVRALDPTLKKHLAEQVFFEFAATPERLYVQAELVVRRRLYYVDGAQLYGELPLEPAVDGATVRRLAEARHSTQVRGGNRYGVIEQSFSVFPERSGVLLIPAVTITASVMFQPGPDTRYRRTELEVISPVRRFTVLPIPSSYPTDAPWLAASEVEILEDWPHASDPFDVGTPSNRTLLVRAEGATASMIPPLAITYPAAIRAYPDAPQLSDQVRPEGVVGVRTQATSVVATQPGAITFPEISLTWWDTRREEVRRSTLPARVARAVGTATPESAPEPRPAPVAVAPESPRAPMTKSAVPSLLTVPRYPAAIALLFALAAGCTAFLWKRRRNQARDPKPPTTEARTFARLRAACRRRDATAIRRALDAWLTTHYRVSLHRAVARFCHDAAARASVDALNGAIYHCDRQGHDKSTHRFDAAPLLAAVSSVRDATRRTIGPDPLPPLYPRPPLQIGQALDYEFEHVA